MGEYVQVSCSESDKQRGYLEELELFSKFNNNPKNSALRMSPIYYMNCACSNQPGHVKSDNSRLHACRLVCACGSLH